MNKMIRPAILDERPDLFIPVDWGSHFVCERCGQSIPRGVANYSEHYFNCNGQVTEDADFEIIEPKQLPPSTENQNI